MAARWRQLGFLLLYFCFPSPGRKPGIRALLWEAIVIGPKLKFSHIVSFWKNPDMRRLCWESWRGRERKAKVPRARKVQHPRFPGE